MYTKGNLSSCGRRDRPVNAAAPPSPRRAWAGAPRGRERAHRLALAVAMAVGASAAPALAGDGVVGPGHCDGAGFASVVSTVDSSGGGTVTFNCGSATIFVTGHAEIASSVVIDGAGKITLDGGDSTAFFQIYNSGSLVLKGLTLQHATFAGGHNVLENFGQLTLDHVIVFDNDSSQPTVANHFGDIDIRWSTFRGNNVATSDPGSSSDGGAIAHFGGTLDVRYSTFWNNSADGYGGAIFSEAEMHLHNSTFTGNGAGLGGGAIFQQGSGNSTLDYLTLVDNEALYGAGIYNEGSANSTLTISRSLLVGNIVGNCDGVIQSGGYNLEDGSNCGGAFTATGDLTGQYLVMGAMTDHGGPTATRLPQTGNPAINHIPANQCGAADIDQRGAGRPHGSHCDSGAVEVGAAVDLIFLDGFE